MKCNNCGNTVLDGTTVCPYCNADLSDQISSTPDITITPIDESSNPVMPAVEPANNEMMNNPVVNNTPLEMPSVVNETSMPEVKNDYISNTPVADFSLGNSASEPVQTTPVVESVPEPIMPTLNEEPINNVNEVSAPVAEEVKPVEGIETPNPVEPAVTEEVKEETNVPLATDFTSAIPTVESPGIPVVETVTTPVKKGGKKGLKVFLVILLLLVGAAAFIYFYEFKSADKRISAVINGLFKEANITGIVDKSSGKYSVNMVNSSSGTDIENNTTTIDLSGNYSFDLKNKILTSTIDINKIKYDEYDILEGVPLNFGLAIGDGNLYILFENFFSKYIEIENAEIDMIFEALKNNDIDQDSINSIRDALVSGLNAADYEQKITDAKLNGTNKKVNAVIIKLDNANMKKVVLKTLETLADDKAFTKKLDDSSKNELNELIDQIKAKELDEEDDAVVTLNIYTGLVGETFEGITLVNKYSKEESNIEFYQTKDGYHFIINETSNDPDSEYVKELIYDGNITIQKKSDSLTDTTTVIFTGNGTKKQFDIEEIQAVSLNVSISADKDPVVGTIPFDRSVRFEDLTENDLIEIIARAQNNPALGSIINDYKNSLFPSEEEIFVTNVNSLIQTASIKYSSEKLNGDAHSGANESFDAIYGVSDLDSYSNISGTIYVKEIDNEPKFYAALYDTNYSFHSNESKFVPYSSFDLDLTYNSNSSCSYDNGFNC